MLVLIRDSETWLVLYVEVLSRNILRVWHLQKGHPASQEVCTPQIKNRCSEVWCEVTHSPGTLLSAQICEASVVGKLFSVWMTPAQCFIPYYIYISIMDASTELRLHPMKCVIFSYISKTPFVLLL
jgi:hypothetical protein